MSKHFIVDHGRLEYTGKSWPKTRKHALLLSIEKWQSLAELHQAGVNELNEVNCKTCALCQIYVEVQGYCDNCPVMEKTGQPECEKTPYIQYDDAETRVAHEKVARAELLFLQNLYNELYPNKAKK